MTASLRVQRFPLRPAEECFIDDFNNKSLDTVLCEEDWETTEPAGLLARPPLRGLQTLKREALLLGGRPPKSLRAGLRSRTAFSGSVKRL